MYTTESVFACVPHPERGRAIVLNGDPKGKNMLYTNGHTVVIRDIAVSLAVLQNVIDTLYIIISMYSLPPN